MSEPQTVAIWKSRLLPGSETFIRNQANALERWRPALFGAVKVDSPIAASTDITAYPDTIRGRRKFLLFRLTGRSSQITTLLTRIRPALVHAHFGPEGWLISRATQRIGVPLVLTLHGHDVTAAPQGSGVSGLRTRRKLKAAFNKAALIIAASEFLRSRAIDLGADPRKVRVHYIGVPIPTYSPRVFKEWDIIFVGRFVEKKGAEDLVEALGKIQNEARPRCVFIGTGPFENKLRNRVAELGLNCTFAGSQPPNVVERYLERSKIFVGPSKTASNGDAEGLGMVFLEAAARGIPVVSYQHGGVSEAVLHGRTGLLCAEGDLNELARNIGLLLADNELRERLGRQARQFVESNFDIAKQTALLEELYDRVALQTTESWEPYGGLR